MIDAMIDAIVDAVVECGSVRKIFGERAATQPVPVPGNAAGTPGHGALGASRSNRSHRTTRISGIMVVRSGLVMCG